MNTKVYPRTNDFQTIYLNTVIKNPAIIVGEMTRLILRRTTFYIIILLTKTG